VLRRAATKKSAAKNEKGKLAGIEYLPGQLFDALQAIVRKKYAVWQFGELVWREREKR